MHIRLAAPSDYNATATVATQATLDDEIDAFLFPGRHAHPQAYHRLYLSRIRNHSKQPQCLVVIAGSEPRIAGYCLWVRDGNGEITRQRWRTKEGFIESVLNRILWYYFGLELTVLRCRGPTSN
jgi:hypothetical protein